MIKLNVEYRLKNGEPIVFNGVSMYQTEQKIPIDLYSSKDYDGQWNEKGQYMSNIYFLDRKETGLDIVFV